MSVCHWMSVCHLYCLPNKWQAKVTQSQTLASLSTMVSVSDQPCSLSLINQGLWSTMVPDQPDHGLCLWSTLVSDQPWSLSLFNHGLWSTMVPDQPWSLSLINHGPRSTMVSVSVQPWSLINHSLCLWSTMVSDQPWSLCLINHGLWSTMVSDQPHDNAHLYTQSAVSRD